MGEETAGRALGIALLVVTWYTTNILLLLVNKWLMSYTGFNQPVFLTLCHMVVCTIISYAGSLAGYFPRRHMSWVLWGKVTILSAAFCASLVSGIAAFAYIPASFIQALGSTTPVFTAILALLIQGRREANITYIALIPVVLGIVVASGGEPLFNLVGTLLCLASGAFRGLKSVVQAIMMTDPNEKFHEMSLLMYTSISSVVLLLPTLLLLEPDAIHNSLEVHRTNPRFAPLLLASCVMAFLANWCNFTVTKVLGALTLQVLGNAKNVVAAGVSVAIFRNPVTLTGLLGYAVTVGGVVWYSDCVKKYKAETLWTVALFKTTPGVAAPPRARVTDVEDGVPPEKQPLLQPLPEVQSQGQRLRSKAGTDPSAA